MNQSIPYGKQFLDESDINAVTAALKSDFLTCGPQVEKFEQGLCDITGSKHAVACANGTAALHLACLVLEIGPGDLALTTPNTFLASANCVEFCGGTVDFIDINPDTLCLSVDALEQYCREVQVPKLVITVDFAGVPAELPRIWELSKKFGFKVIEDAAHAAGSSYHDEGKEYYCGSCMHSDLAVFSFHPVKTITTGEGGAILTNDDDLAERLKLLRNHGMTKEPEILTRNDGAWYYEMHRLGYNYRITDIQCALGCTQLEKLHQFKDSRQKIVRKYNQAFSDSMFLETPPWPEDTSPSFHLYPVQFAGGPETRKRVYEKLQSLNVFTQVHYIPVYWQPYYKKKYRYPEGKCANAEKYYSKCLSLPLFPTLCPEDQAFIIDSILNAEV